MRLRMADLVRALRLVWIVTGIAAGALLVAPFLLPPASIARWVPQCEWQARYGRPCALCGMTTAFYAIARGRFADASHENRGSVPLFAGLAGNEACLLAVGVGGSIRRRRGGNR